MWAIVGLPSPAQPRGDSGRGDAPGKQDVAEEEGAGAGMRKQRWHQHRDVVMILPLPALGMGCVQRVPSAPRVWQLPFRGEGAGPRELGPC